MIETATGADLIPSGPASPDQPWRRFPKILVAISPEAVRLREVPLGKIKTWRIAR